MNKWILSIIAIVFISILIQFFLPEGKLNKYVKSFFGIATILVVIQPIFMLKNNNLDIDFNEEQSQIVFQNNYLDFISQEYIYYKQIDCQNLLKENGFNGVEVYIEYTVSELGETEILSALIDLKNAEYNFDPKNIDIIEDIIKPISKYLEVKEEQVNVVE